MFYNNVLIGASGSACEIVQILIDQSTGTAIGNMTAAGGLSAAFDGNTDQSNSQTAKKTSADGYCGKDWGSGVTKTVTGVKIWGSNNNGYSGGGTCEARLQGSTDNFSSSVVELGTIATGLSSSVTDAREKMSGLTVSTDYRYHRVIIDYTGTSSTFLAEVEFYEDACG